MTKAGDKAKHPGAGTTGTKTAIGHVGGVNPITAAAEAVTVLDRVAKNAIAAAGALAVTVLGGEAGNANEAAAAEADTILGRGGINPIAVRAIAETDTVLGAIKARNAIIAITAVADAFTVQGGVGINPMAEAGGFAMTIGRLVTIDRVIAAVNR